MVKLFRCLIPAFLLILIFQINSEAKSELGKIVQMAGDIDMTEGGSNIRFVPGIGTQITAEHRIRTGAKSYIEILLNDNTKIFMRELSIVQIKSLKMKADDQPTRIIFSTGKIRINVNKPYRTRNLIIRTNVAVIGVRDDETDLGIITTDYETKLAVFDGTADIANINRDIIKSFDVKKKEESSIKLKSSPSEPVVLPQDIMDSWLDYYEIADKDRIVIKGKNEDSLIDFMLKKRKF